VSIGRPIDLRSCVATRRVSQGARVHHKCGQGVEAVIELWSSCQCLLLTHVSAGKQLSMICLCAWAAIAVGVHGSPIDLPGCFATERVSQSARVDHKCGKGAEAVIELCICPWIIISLNMYCQCVGIELGPFHHSLTTPSTPPQPCH
jgi:hypothetical protein